MSIIITPSATFSGRGSVHQLKNLLCDPLFKQQFHSIEFDWKVTAVTLLIVDHHAEGVYFLCIAFLKGLNFGGVQLDNYNLYTLSVPNLCICMVVRTTFKTAQIWFSVSFMHTFRDAVQAPVDVTFNVYMILEFGVHRFFTRVWFFEVEVHFLFMLV